jgi:hypothetical protein
MRRQIVTSVRAGESVTRVAERLLDIDKPIVRLPQHVRELRDAAVMALHQGDRNIYDEAVQKWRSQVERLGQGPEGGPGAHTIRSATQQLVKDLGSAKLEQIDHIAERWVLERARYQARVIARTETVEAFRDVYKETTAKQPYVVGYRWQLSGGHPRPDVCDTYAHQDIDGLGPGGYLPGNIPGTPHPHDLCSQVAIVDNNYFKRELAKRRGTEEPDKPWESGQKLSGADWLKQQSEAFQKRLLGPTLHKAFSAGRNVLDPTGKALPVHVVLGRPRPERRLGRAVDATGAIRRDRARGQVRPFPSVGQREPPRKAFGRAKREPELAPWSASEALGEAWSKRSRDGGVAIRAKTRETLDGTLKLERRSRSAENEVIVTRMRPGVLGQFSWSGRITLDPSIAERIQPALDNLKAGAGAFSNTEIDAVRVLLHEEIHGYGQLTPSAYVGVGAFVEEAATETVARIATRRVAGLQAANLPDVHPLALPRRRLVGVGWVHKARSYDHWIAAIAEEVENVSGWAEERVVQALEEASLVFKRKSTAITDANELGRQWVEGVPKLRVEQRAALLEKLKERARVLTKKWR